MNGAPSVANPVNYFKNFFFSSNNPESCISEKPVCSTNVKMIALSWCTSGTKGPQIASCPVGFADSELCGDLLASSSSLRILIELANLT